ncbi:hypothetical protein [Sodalis glossinidius]|nr:hypothetical protein [Sodalis glossinidius]
MFDNTLRDIATHPGDWSEEGLRDVLLIWCGWGRRPVRSKA